MRKCFMLMLLCLLVSCVTEKNSVRIRDDKTQKISTARINAQLGIAYLRMHNVERAKTKLLSAMNEAPGIPETWYAMAYFMETTGNPDIARRDYLKAIQLEPSRGDAHNNYGTFLCRHGQYKEAISQFLLAARDTHYLTPADAYENAGLCAMKIPNDALALQYLHQAVNEDPERASTFLALARLHYAQGNFPASRENLTRYLAMASSTQETEQLANSLHMPSGRTVR